MDRAHIQSQGMALRYLAGSLSEEESRAFEAACAADPALLDDFDTDFKLKAGLARLAELGEIDAAVASATPASSRLKHYLWAASLVAAVGLATSVYFAVQTSVQRQAIAGLRGELASRGAPRLLGSVQRIVQLRGDRIDVELPSQGWLGLSIDATGLEGMEVVVELRRERAASVLRQAHHVPRDGTLFIAADSAGLQAGDYTVSITPQAAGTPPAGIVYRIRIIRNAAP